MKGILAVYRREIGSYFVSPIAYIVIGLFLVVCGVFFYFPLKFYSSQALMMQMRGGPLDVPTLVLSTLFSWVNIIMLFVVPMLTMGVYAEERKRGTLELLMTSPLTEFQIASGKFFAGFTLLAAMVAPTFAYQLILAAYADPNIPWNVIWSAYLGVLLLGAVLVAIGSFISSLTESQIIAGVVTFAAFILLWVLDITVRDSTSTFGEIVQYFSLLRHYEDFTRGVIDTTSIVFYASLTGLGVFLTQRSLDSMRWRRA